jgi:8-oxo-dGTP diphosphatase
MLAEEVHFCPRCGTRLGAEERMGRVRPVCPHCEWIFFPDPKVAAGVVVQRDGEVLLVQRAYSPQKGRWTLPVGFVDAGEEPPLTAERECLEETGLEIEVTGLLDVFYGQEHPRGAHIIFIFRGKIIGGKLHPGDDASNARFFSKNGLPPLAFQSTHVILERFI